ncbi:MAG: DUF1501 domain-containing protein [Ardenticatenaceae bacterium]|nr:DUF1501 domain-containing protein [Ardenticatenaceae bacterium]
MTLTRRDFLQSTAALGIVGASKGLFPRWMPRLAFHPHMQSGPGDVLVVVFLRGGMDGLSAVVPLLEGDHYFDARPTLAVPEALAVNLDGRFALHPALSPLKEIYDDAQLAIVHAAGLTDDTRSHFDAMRFMEYGTPGSKLTGTGWIGRHLQTAAWQNDSPFRAVGMGALLPDSLRGGVTPLSLQSIADFHFRGREDEFRALQHSLASMYSINAPGDGLEKQAGLVFETVELVRQLNAQHYQPAGGASYPEGEFGLGLQQVAQLIKAGVGLEVACIDLGGWDTHENQGTMGGTFAALLDSLGRGLHAFYTDLGEAMRRVTLVTMSEFGRRVQENGSAGTDHGHGNVMFLLGGGVNGRQVFTEWPSLAPQALADGDLAITTDYRDVLAEVVSLRLGNPAIANIFPNHAPKTLGLVRPFSL